MPMTEKHLHPFAALQIFRKTLVLYAAGQRAV